MKLSLGVRARMFGAGLLMLWVAACGGRAEDGGLPGPGPGEPPPGPAVPPAAEIRGWANPFGSAAVVLGQIAFDQVDPQGTGATPIPNPFGSPAVSANGRLFVASGTRLLGFDQFDAMNGPAAAFDVELEPNSVVSGVSVQGPKVILVADHQVRIFNSGDPSSAPDVFSGQPTTFCSDAVTLRQPRSAFLTPLGQLIVADSFNHRVLIWNTVPNAGQLGAADLVLGQRTVDRCVENDDDGDGTTDTPNARTMSHPISVWSDGVRLVVADSNNHRILVWDSFPNALDPDSHYADHVIGQANFASITRNAGQNEPSAASLSKPYSIDVSEAGELAVADSGNNRVLIWKSIPTSDGKSADLVVGQSDFVHGNANDIDQRAVDGTTPSAKTLSSPVGVRFHGRNLIVNDTGNGRVLVWQETD